MTSTSAPIQEMGSITIKDKENEQSQCPNSNIHVESFAIEVRDDPLMEGSTDGTGQRQKAIVGTVTFFNQSVMVWLGWGETQDQDQGGEQEQGTTCSGTGFPTMGPLVVAMPRSKYAGFGSNNEVPCSQLIGGPDDEEMLLGWQMASRLTKKVGCPVFVSTSINSSNGLGENSSNHDDNGTVLVRDLDESSVLHAVAMAEKTVGDIILKRKENV